MFPGGNDPNNVARVAQLLKNPQYLNMLASKMGGNGVSPFLPGQPTLIHHPTAGTSISSSHLPPNTMASLMAAQSAALQQQHQQQQQQQHQHQQQQQQGGNNGMSNSSSTNNGGTRIPPSSAVVNMMQNGAQNTTAKWHDDLSRNTRQELFNTIVEIKTGKSFNGDKSSIDSNLSKAILNQISKIWKQTNSKEQFAKELSQWLASENSSIYGSDVEKKLLELMNKPQTKQPTSSVGVENLFGMMTTAASSIGTNSSFPNITNPINAKNPGPTVNQNGQTTNATTNATTTSNTTTSTAVNNNNSNNNGSNTTSAPSVSNNNNNNQSQNPQAIKKLTSADAEKYLGFVDFLKQHEDMIRQYIRTVATQHAELTKRFKSYTSIPPEEQNKMKTSIQKNQMILAESKSLEKLLSLTTKEDRLKLIETFTQKSFAFAVHIRDVIEKKLKTPNATQPPTQPPTTQPPATTASTTASTSTSTTTSASTTSSTTTSNSAVAPPSNSTTTQSTPQSSVQATTSSTNNPTPTPSAVPQNHKKESSDDGFYNLKKIGESSIITFNQDSFYSAVGEVNTKSLTPSTKRKLIPESTEYEKVLKRVKTPLDILQNNLNNLIEFDNILEFKTKINIKNIEDARYQLDFIINPAEKGILNLPILSLCVIVNHNEIIPYSISFSHNYANEKNTIFVNIRKYFNNLLIENTTSFINTSEMLSTHNNTYHIQRYNLSLNCILNSWITSINTVVKKELQ